MASLKNPFDLVKATDLTDSQIDQFFVDFPSGGSLLDRVKPTSAMPMIIFGGKGSGKTHLMRYLSYPLQLRRHGTGAAGRAGIRADGYLGIYFRCGGLNAHRFGGKGQSEDVWRDVFEYYMEIWFGQLLLHTILEVYGDQEAAISDVLLREAVDLLDVPPERPVTSLEELLKHLEHLQRRADIAINNCALARSLDLQIQATAGKLVFGLPKLLVKHIPDLEPVVFLYLIDEFENLTEAQQRYIQTLVREREFPVTLKLGVRLYGLKTSSTLSANEENREDSEYEVLRLDTELRERRDETQRNFATAVVTKRLVDAGYLTESEVAKFNPSTFFEGVDDLDLLTSRDAGFGDRLPPYLSTLKLKLESGYRSGVANGIRSGTDIQRVIELLRYEKNLLIERTSVFLFYRAWAKRENLVSAAERLNEGANNYPTGKSAEHKKVLRYFKSDIVAQFVRETRQKQRYVGYDTFVKMSAGLPRGLLTILKHIFTWSVFYGEKPFVEGVISVRAQADGISQAAEWFFTEARAPGVAGKHIRDAMTRLGQLLREVRFSDKPSECSLSTFSANVTEASEAATLFLEGATNWSMLIRVVGGQHDRNDGRVDDKFQIHPMLAPRWDLPISRRGALALTGEEVDAIFAPEFAIKFEEILKRRIVGMTAPFFGVPPKQMRSNGLFQELSGDE